MPSLLIQGGTTGPSEIKLAPGVNRIGRNETNDHQIQDGSVSSFHCEVTVNDAALLIKDLGSTNGTFVDSQRVDEAALQPGQILKLGSVEMVYAPGLAPMASAGETVRPRIRVSARTVPAANEGPVEPATTSRPPPLIAPATGNDCAYHPGLPAKFVCQTCETRVCKSCVKSQHAGSATLYSCPHCNGICVTAGEFRKRKTLRDLTFGSAVKGAFAYPFKQNGVILLVCGTIFFTVLQLAVKVALGGFALIFLLVLSLGYLFACMQGIINSSTHGDENMPDWPEISSFWDDIFMAFIRFVTIWAVCLGPGIAALVFDHRTAGIALLCLGIFCLPMSLLTVSIADSLGGLNPLIIFSSIAKVPGTYLGVCAFFLATAGLAHASQSLLTYFSERSLPFVMQIIPLALGNFIALYGLTLQMRILGLLYFTKKDKLAWF